MKKVLVFSYFFAPQNIVSSIRVTKFVKFMARDGYESYIYTSDDSSIMINDSLLKDIPDNTHIHRKKYIREIQRSSGKSVPGKIGLINKAKRIIIDIFFSPDKYVWWSLLQVPEIIKTIKKHDIEYVYTTGNPFSLMLAMVIVKKITKVNLIIDFRDPWVGNVVTENHTFVRKLINRLFEKVCVRKADAVISVTSEIIENLKSYSSNKSKFHHIPNGYDPEDFKSVKKNRRDDNVFEFLYTGKYSVNIDNYNPETVIKAFIKFSGNKNDKRYILRFIGNSDKQTSDYLKDLRTDNVIFEPAMAREEVLQNQASADALLHFYYPRTHTDAISMKVFEYAHQQKPIISFNVMEGELFDFMTKNKLGISEVSNNIDKMVKAFQNMVKHHDEYGKSSQLSDYNYEKLTGRLINIMKLLQER